MADSLERAYWGPNSDSRLGPMQTDYDAPLESDTTSDDHVPIQDADVSLGKAALVGGLVLLLTIGCVWATTNLWDRFRHD